MSTPSISTPSHVISAFISYSHTPLLRSGSKAPLRVVNEHKKWVLELANRLRAEGINAILDQTHLKPGHDAFLFMESTVTDEKVKKIIIVVDLAYTEKANAGGEAIGTDSQIIPPEIYNHEIYNHADTTKFVTVLRQRDVEGNEVLPTFLQNLAWIDMSSDQLVEENFESLLRALADKPLQIPATVGHLPSFLEEAEPRSPASLKIRGAQSALLGAKSNAAGFIQDALDAVRDDLLARAIEEDVPKDELDKALFVALDQWTPVRDEYLGLIRASLRYGKGQHLVGVLPAHFESYLPNVTTEFQRQSPHEAHIIFAVYELWLQTTALFLDAGAFEALADLIHARYRCREHGKPFLAGFTVFRPWDASYIEGAKKRVDPHQFASPVGQLLKERASENSVPFDRVCEADTLLLLCDLLNSNSLESGHDGNRSWWNYTRPYIIAAEGIIEPEAFEFLQRSRSRTYFERFRPVIGDVTAEELKKMWLKIVGEESKPLEEIARATIIKELTRLITKIASQP